MEGKCKISFHSSHLHLAALFSLMDASICLCHSATKTLSVACLLYGYVMVILELVANGMKFFE
jgi:hypothetical protein